MNIVRHYQPGTTAILFDHSIHQRFNGVLFFAAEETKKAVLTVALANFRSKMEKDIATLMPNIEFPQLKLPQIKLPSFKIHISPFSYLVTAYTFLFLAIFLITIYFLPILIYNLRFPTLPSNLQKTVTTNPPSSPAPSFESSEVLVMNPEIIAKNAFRIIIPKINLEEDVVANVDISNEEEYQKKLELGVAHAQGSYLPGQNGLVYLFSHSTDSVFNILQYDARFFGLKDIEKGDLVMIAYNGKKYTYVVSNKRIMAPNQVDQIRKSASSLVLQTCWPFGTDWQRLVVFAEEIKKI